MDIGMDYSGLLPDKCENDMVVHKCMLDGLKPVLYS